MFKIYEISLAAAAWATLLLLVVLSWKAPVFVTIYIVLFDTYWLLKTFYLFAHLKHSYLELRKNQVTNWLSVLKTTQNPRWLSLRHLIIIPTFQEPYETIRASLESILASNYPKEHLYLILALEKRASHIDRLSAKKLSKEFKKHFGRFLITIHPKGLKGELPGKGSNQSYAAKEAQRLIIDPQNIPYENVIISVFDSDTRPGPEYFGILANRYLSQKNPLRASYQPTPVFTNNIYKTSFLSRILGFTCTFWQFMQQARSHELTTFSSHSMPWKTLVDVGFYNKTIVAEDSHIFFQCLLHFKGDYRVVPVEYPVYMDSVEGRTFKETAVNLYKQQRRWAWGAENLPLVWDAFRKDVKNTIPRKIKIFWRYKMWTGLYSWSTSPFILFLFGWLPTMIGHREFQNSVLAYNLPTFTSTLMNISVVSLVLSAALSATLLPPPPKNWNLANRAYFLLGWIFAPLALLFFSGVPALDAQTRLALGGKRRLDFWRTPKQLTNS